MSDQQNEITPEYKIRPELNNRVEQLTSRLKFLNEYHSYIDVRDYERPEQVLNVKFLDPNSKVLEIGARYGVVSCFINQCLSNKKNHLVVEPDSSVLNVLKYNRKSNECEFHIFDGTISNQPMKLVPGGSATRSVYDKQSLIENKTYQELERHYNITFDALVVDCEGYFEEFLTQFQKDLTNIKYIFLEYDFPNYCNYQNVEKILTEMGFHIEYQQLSFWRNLSCYHKIWIR
jgi:FkbM family methyltransferase